MPLMVIGCCAMAIVAVPAFGQSCPSFGTDIDNSNDTYDAGAGDGIPQGEDINADGIDDYAQLRLLDEILNNVNVPGHDAASGCSDGSGFTQNLAYAVVLCDLW